MSGKHRNTLVKPACNAQQSPERPADKLVMCSARPDPDDEARCTKVESGSENIRRLKAEMYCEEMKFTYGSGAAWA